MSLELSTSRYKLEDICLQITDGKHGDCENQENSGYYFVSVKDIDDGVINYSNARQITKFDFEDTDKRTKLENEDILITNSGTIGKFVFVNSPLSRKTTFQKSVAIIKPNKNKIMPKFLYYYLISEKRRLVEYAGGTTQKNLLLRDIRNFEVEIPNETRQKKIIELLNNIDQLISVNKKLNKNLRNLIKILYKDYFESFELNNIPNDWEIINLESIIDIYNGYSYKGKELQESNCGIVTIKNFNRDGSFRIDGFKEIVYSTKIKKHHFINENDVLISCTDVTQDADIIGNCIIVLDKQKYNELIMSMDLVKIESKIPEINNFLLATIFKSYSFKKHILGYVNGTTVLHLDKKGIKKFKIALPKDLSELKNISERLEIFYSEIQCNQKEINKLVNLRDALLPKLMSGEIDVSKFEI
ncbi:restriction endonuclease subunit S [uncultured Methanobrevibacter sp.]|uniref:restriction endonuclease subunit S n=1 Tax=uncultured Methanobrevibacter sp. TaxID=253161 RepID=UPI0025E26D78|nr:restriction endonuclease subunit S [uncultured Methanobrevibacter sp.]